MHLLAYLPLLFPALAAVAARPLAEHLEPRLATWLLTASTVALAAFSTAALGVLAVAGLVRLPLVAWVGHWSATTVRAGDPVSTAEAALSCLLLATAVYAALRLLWRRVRALVAAGFEAACLPGIDELVVLEDPAPEAYALPGLPGRVVVSTGMLDALDEADREAMLAHERGHLAAHHYAFVAATHLAAAANPLLRPAATAVAYTVERWADEHAAAVCGDRRQVARAVGKAALASRHTPDRGRLSAAALGLLGMRRDPVRRAGPVPRRVAALLKPRPPRYPLLPLGACAAVVGASGLCAFAAAHDLHVVLKLAGAG
ncbi:M56 family metallopeptidase [Streptantibioticus rubrisoli]|uniref:M48 family metalloprotease n=1 Tax=Streptantibioticus rubrisoli TaxID=1387313 RepID=A0ABT1PGK5_9ACTN|nr:M56 family metallopeptidase [Streptantibioticus rubrisoli]MCQ4044498.1 M48 family metalloprotease [Streptantibioticus rubrisoli]